jgi:hypothetical protein
MKGTIADRGDSIRRPCSGIRNPLAKSAKNSRSDAMVAISLEGGSRDTQLTTALRSFIGDCQVGSPSI